MAARFKTRDVAKSLYVNYLKRAEECFRAAKSSFAAQEWNSATISAIHSVISASDAMCVYFLGKRNAGENHSDAAALFKTIKADDEEISANANRIIRTLGIKTAAEYDEGLVFRAGAERALKDCERFLGYVKSKLPKIR